ncbi:hypothetical protein ACLI07_00795 [Providencia huaxiensis]|uniref:SpaN/EivJ family type III secretion system needle length determinant n=1 Tax=Providencia TaxID=586 RepID=UPI00234B32FD|nr:hypothetical protein [Providencia sp. PROV076]
MSVTKASSYENTHRVVAEENGISSTYSTTEFSHNNIAKRMAKAANDKNMLVLFEHKKKKNQQKDASPFLTVAPPSMQQTSQLSNLAKGIITYKESTYIDEGIQTAGQNKEFNTKGVESLISHYVFTEDNSENISHITSTPAVDLIDILNKSDIDNNLSATSTIPVEQNIVDEDETPLFNTMMVAFPLQDIQQREKGKANDHSGQYGKSKFQLSDEIQLNMENSLAELASKSALEPTSKELKPQIKTGQEHIKHAIEPASHPHIDEQPFTENKLVMQPVASSETSSSYDKKRVSLPENATNNFSDTTQDTMVSPQTTPVEEMESPTNFMATVFNGAMSSSEPVQATQPKQEVHRIPELIENNPLLGESKQLKAVSRSLTYTFNQWQSSPSVTFELASKGEFVASTASQEVQLALNENKHLLNHETSVHIQREDERQQHRNRQQHDQPQEED